MLHALRCTEKGAGIGDVYYEGGLLLAHGQNRSASALAVVEIALGVRGIRWRPCRRR